MHTDHVKYERRVCACFQHDLKKNSGYVCFKFFDDNFNMSINVHEIHAGHKKNISAPKCIYEDVKIVSLLLLFSNRVKIHFFVMASVNQHN